MNNKFTTTVILFILLAIIAALSALLLSEWNKIGQLELYLKNKVAIEDMMSIKNIIIPKNSFILPVFQSAALFATAFVGFKNFKALEEKQVSEIFSKAIEHLGNENTIVCLGGIYSLQRLATNSPEKYYSVVLNTLSACARNRMPANNTVSVTIISVVTELFHNDSICKQLKIYVSAQNIDKTKYEEEKQIDLSKIFLEDADLPRLNLSKINFSGAKLSRVNLEEARLTNTKLIDTELIDAKLKGAILTDADLTGAKLMNATLANAKLKGAILTDANLTGADLTSANLAGADLSGTDLTDADLTGVDLSTSKNLTETQLRMVKTYDRAQLPSNSY
jgi:hypothetical protein